jgi:hypothetical protein
VLTAPRSAVVLILPDRNQPLTAGTARSFGDGVATTGGVQALVMALAVLPVRHHVAGAAPQAATVPSSPPDRKLIVGLDLPGLPARLRGHRRECFNAGPSGVR